MLAAFILTTIRIVICSAMTRTSPDTFGLPPCPRLESSFLHRIFLSRHVNVTVVSCLGYVFCVRLEISSSFGRELDAYTRCSHSFLATEHMENSPGEFRIWDIANTYFLPRRCGDMEKYNCSWGDPAYVCFSNLEVTVESAQLRNYTVDVQDSY
jgi:hypothetical protein